VKFEILENRRFAGLYLQQVFAALLSLQRRQAIGLFRSGSVGRPALVKH
jgi:hypothetical protein